jgi:hypothetical protein
MSVWLLAINLVNFLYLHHCCSKLSLFSRPQHISSLTSLPVSPACWLSTLPITAPCTRGLGSCGGSPLSSRVVQWKPWLSNGSVTEPSLQEHSLIHYFPYSHYSANSSNCMEDPYDADSIYNSYYLVHLYCLELELNQGL